jgi:hypothetical protein
MAMVPLQSAVAVSFLRALQWSPRSDTNNEIAPARPMVTDRSDAVERVPIAGEGMKLGSG